MQKSRFARLEQGLDRVLNLLTEPLAVVAGVGCFAVILLVVAETVTRYTQIVQLIVAEEYTGYLLVTVTVLAAGSSFRDNLFPRLTFIVKLLPGRARQVLDLLALGAAAAVTLVYTVLAWQLLQQTIRLRATAWTVMHTPLAIPQGIMVAGLVLFEVTLILVVVKAVLATLSEPRNCRRPERTLVGVPRAEHDDGR